MTTSVGVSAFGLNDRVCVGTERKFCISGTDEVPQFVPACVVLTGSSGKETSILTGEKAASSRIHTGFHWPQESRLPLRLEELRRFPVSLLWERLVASKGRPCNVAGYPVEMLLKAHVDAVSPAQEDVRRVLAVPNTLTTAAQERLLRAFGLERHNVTLLWRPIAAVLGWLDRMDRAAFQRVANTDGWVGVCYMGADGIEFTKIHLNLSRDDYVVPVRSRPKQLVNNVREDGFDLLGEFLSGEQYQGRAERWQAALRMPDLWRQAAERRPEEKEELWSLNGRWAVWRAAEAESPVLNGCANPVPFINEIRGRANSFDRNSWGRTRRLSAYAKEAFADKTGNAPNCLGLIVCGALASDAGWIEALNRQLGLESQLGSSPAVGHIFIANEDLVARGCCVYGERLIHNEASAKEKRLPTYFDTLPKMQLYVATDEALVWQSLFDSDYCEGGQEVTNKLDVFALRSGSLSVEMWLMLVDEDVNPENLPDEVTEDLDRTPYSFAEVIFVKSHDEEIKLSLTASMQPSSGFAEISFVPQDERFNDILRGGGVHLTIDDMVPKRGSDLPKLQRSWPPEGKRKTYRPYWFVTGLNKQLRFGGLDPLWLIDQLMKKNALYGEKTWYEYLVNEEGNQSVCSPALWEKLLDEVEKRGNRQSSVGEQWLRAGSWLWRGCPDRTRQEIFLKMNDSGNPTIIGYGARTARTDKEIEEVFIKLQTYLSQKKDGDFGSVAARSATYLLDMNPKAAEVLAGKPFLLDFLLRRIAQNLNWLSNPKGETVKFLKYQWLPTLFAAMLKVRKWNKTFLRDPKEVDLWVNRIERLGPAVESFLLLKHKDPAIATVLKDNYVAIINYVKGCGNDVPLLAEDLAKDF